MKRLVLLSLLLLLLGTAVACSGQTATTSAPDTAVEVNANTELDLADTINVQTAASVKDRDDVIVLDVREQWEYDEGHIPGVTLIPMGEVANRLTEIPTDKEVIVTCRSGNRSAQITDFLREQGFANVHNMEGGILAWEAAGYEVEQ